MAGERTPQPLQASNYKPQYLKPGETMPALPTSEVIAKYPARRRPDGTPMIAPVSRLQHRSRVAGELPSHVLSNHTLLEVVPERLWSFPVIGHTKDATNEPSLALRGRQEREQEELRWFLYREEHREEARQINQANLEGYRRYIEGVDPQSPEGKAIQLARLVNGIADNDPAAINALLGMIDRVAGEVPAPVMGILGMLGDGIHADIPFSGGRKLLDVPGIPAAKQLQILTDSTPDNLATRVAAMSAIQSAIAAGRDAVVSGQPDRIIHERELALHPERHKGKIALRRGARIAGALAPFALSYGAAVILPPVEGTAARVLEAFLGHTVIKQLKARSGEIFSILGSIVADRLSGQTSHSQEAIAVMELLLDVAGVDVSGVGDSLATHMYAQWGLAHPEEFIAANEAVVLDQPYRKAKHDDQEAMEAVMHGRFNKARRLAGVR